MVDRQHIRERAYQLWVKRGRPLWRSLDDWVVAELQLQLLYRVDPGATQWDSQVTLRVIKDETIGGQDFTSLKDFGSQTAACKVVLSGATQSKVLTINSWTPSAITVRLPTHDPAFGPHLAPNLYSLTVDTSGGTGYKPFPAEHLIVSVDPLPNLCAISSLTSALAELVRVQPSKTKLRPLEPMNPTGKLNPVNLSLVKTPQFDNPTTPEARYLKDLVLNKIANLTGVFRIVAPPGGRFNKPTSGELPITLGSLPLPILSGLIPRPNFTPFEGDPAVNAWDFKIELDITVSGLPGCPPLVAKLTSPSITQLPIPMLTVVAAFDPVTWDGSRMILFLRPGGPTPLLDGYLDRRSDSAKRHAVVTNVLTLLRTTIQAVTELVPVFSDLLGGAGRPDMNWFIQRISDRMNSELVVTAQSEHDDLGTYDPGWYDRISSLFIIGMPDGTRFKLFEQKNQKGHELHVAVPDGFLAASYWTLHESAFHKDHRGSFTGKPAVPAPGVRQEGRGDDYPWGSFGNMAKSFSWQG